MALCINRQETSQSHSSPVGPSEGRKTHHMITNIHIIMQFLFNLPPPLISIPTCREAAQGARFQGKWVYNRPMPNLSTNKHFCRFSSFLKTWTPASLPLPDFGLLDLSSEIPVT